MSGALVVLWLGTAAALEAHEPDLSGWAASRLVRIEEPLPEPPLPPAGHDGAAAEAIERLLSEARTETYSESPMTGEAALDAAERLLAEHADLPEAPFLAAEAWRERAEIVGERDPALSAELVRRALAIAGTRARLFASAEGRRARAEGDAGDRDAPKAAAESTVPATRVPLEGPLATDEVEIDGVDMPYPPTLPDGAHHVRVLRRGRLAWAGWITPHDGAARVPLPQRAPCSETDLAPARTARAGDAFGAVSCARYAIARATGPSRIEVALCRQAACGPWLPWSRSWGVAFEGPVHSPQPSPRGSSWILWAAGGVAAVVVGGIVLVEAGAFERRGATRETFEFVPPRAVK